MSRQSLHDNLVYAYSVQCDEQRIVLHTEYPTQAAKEYTDVIFLGVLAHHFEGVVKSNILFGIDEVAPEKVVRDWAELFAQQKKYGWPVIKYKDSEELISMLTTQGIKGYEISSSFGLSGWVLATTMQIVPRQGKQVLPHSTSL